MVNSTLDCRDNYRDMLLNDTDPMPFGIHQDTPMGQVPPIYLKWLMENVYKTNKPRGADGAAVHNYICRNWKRIKEGAKV